MVVKGGAVFGSEFPERAGGIENAGERNHRGDVVEVCRNRRGLPMRPRMPKAKKSGERPHPWAREASSVLRTRTRTRTNTNPYGTEASAAGRSGRQGFGDPVLWLALSLDTPLYNPHGKGPFPLITRSRKRGEGRVGLGQVRPDEPAQLQRGASWLSSC